MSKVKVLHDYDVEVIQRYVEKVEEVMGRPVEEEPYAYARRLGKLEGRVAMLVVSLKRVLRREEGGDDDG